MMFDFKENLKNRKEQNIGLLDVIPWMRKAYLDWRDCSNDESITQFLLDCDLENVDLNGNRQYMKDGFKITIESDCFIFTNGVKNTSCVVYSDYFWN